MSDVLIVVPFKFLVSASVEWDKFASACVLYDPPDDTRLLEFAEYGNHYPQAEDNARSLLMSGLPIRSLKDGEYAEQVEAWRWERLIDEVGQRYLEPRGLDIWAMMEEVKKNPPEGFRREYWEKMAENPHRYYIEPDKGTSRESVERARRLIASHQQGRSVRPGQKERDLELAPIGEYRMCQRAVRRLCNPCERCLVRKVARLLAQPLTRVPPASSLA